MELRLLTKDDLSQLVILYEECFNEKINIEFFDWKYFQKPIGKAILVGIFKKNCLIASGALMPEIIELKGEIIFVSKFTDLMTSPLHRKKGLSKKIVSFLTTIGIEKYGIVYTLCSKTATNSFLKMDWNYIDNVIYFFKPLFLSFISEKNQIEFFNSGNIDANLIAHYKIDSYLAWRIKNPKFSYLIAIDKFNKLVVFSIRSKNAFLVYSDYDIDTPDFRKIVSNSSFKLRKNGVSYLIYISISKKQDKLALIKSRFIYNFFNRGKMRSILDFNIINNDSQKIVSQELINNFSPIYYDDI